MPKTEYPTTSTVATQFVGPPTCGGIIPTTRRPRFLVGWRHKIDTPEGLLKGRIWGCVNSVKIPGFHVYNASFNRSRAPGEVRFCGHANFTMVRMFHPYWLVNGNIPRDKHGDDKRAMQEKYWDLWKIRKAELIAQGRNPDDLGVDDPVLNRIIGLGVLSRSVGGRQRASTSPVEEEDDEMEGGNDRDNRDGSGNDRGHDNGGNQGNSDGDHHGNDNQNNTGSNNLDIDDYHVAQVNPDAAAGPPAQDDDHSMFVSETPNVVNDGLMNANDTDMGGTSAERDNTPDFMKNIATAQGDENCDGDEDKTNDAVNDLPTFPARFRAISENQRIDPQLLADDTDPKDSMMIDTSPSGRCTELITEKDEDRKSPLPFPKNREKRDELSKRCIIKDSQIHVDLTEDETMEKWNTRVKTEGIQGDVVARAATEYRGKGTMAEPVLLDA